MHDGASGNGQLAKITHKCAVLTLEADKDEFEGQDAKEIWWDGTPAARAERNTRTREQELEDPELPGLVLASQERYSLKGRSLRSYPMFEAFHYRDRE